MSVADLLRVMSEGERKSAQIDVLAVTRVDSMRVEGLLFDGMRFHSRNRSQASVEFIGIKESDQPPIADSMVRFKICHLQHANERIFLADTLLWLSAPAKRENDTAKMRKEEREMFNMTEVSVYLS